ncbi:MAG: protein TolQ [Gammaproteobacteria bacterium]|nr:MAG: protein TolQ [Gammaproteobacteria bacterium]
MSTDLSIIQLFLNASFVVKLVMLFLIIISVLSWTIIIRKKALLRSAMNATEKFEKLFWSGIDMDEIYSKTRRGRIPLIGTAAIFREGYQEYIKTFNENPDNPQKALESSHRIMQVAMNREIENLESQIPMLATIGSNSPYVGLFGTVWGIMNAFHALGNVKQATLAMVAPGIAEALIATAMGLFAAIPASIAYNDLAHHLEKLENSYENFIQEFYNILQQ